MTTFNGAIRSLNATANRIERERQRQNREAARRFKEQQKLQAIYNAEQAVNDWEKYVETLQTLHKDCSDNVNWGKLNKQAKPKEPKISNKNEKNAKAKIDNYTPSFFDKLLGLTSKQIKKLEKELREALEQDKKDYENAFEKYQSDLSDWEEMQDISRGVLNKEPESYVKALEYYQPFSDISELGAKVNLSIEKEWIDIELHVNGDEVIPNYVLSQTSSGKLSKKNMPKTRFIELYQDHVCSAVLRVGREIFAIVPVEYVRISAMASLLNTQTGFLEEKPILSVIIRPETFNKINLDTIDPSDCMSNFVHTMKFKKASGFEAIDKVDFS